MSIATVNTAFCDIYWEQTFVSNVTKSLIEIRQLSSSKDTTVIDCALVCLNSISCLTAIFNSLINTCQMFNVRSNRSGQILPSLINIATIVMHKDSSYSYSPINSNDISFVVWNVSAGQDSYIASSGFDIGKYYYTSNPSFLFDGKTSTGLCSYGYCNATYYDPICGINTGVYVTARYGSFVLNGFSIATGSWGSSRDPLVITIEGSNQSESSLILGSSWTLTYNGTSGLDNYPGKSAFGTKQMIENNTLEFSSYRILVVKNRGSPTCSEIGEIELLSH
ncbi:hypothetical protein I4U23_005192 [Adineta vaga]|nr:hypothetical protein I4U23_005192 [Adineta vaga]